MPGKREDIGMKIAQIAPLTESCPPKLYGGTERIVSYLTEELVRQGHDVTLFASGDSITSAKLVRCSDMALRLNPVVTNHIPHHLAMLDEVHRRADEFDILHFHIDLFHYSLVRNIADRTLTTLHGRLDLLELKPFYARFPAMPLVSISDSQRTPMPPMNWRGTVYHGLPSNSLHFQPLPAGGDDRYLAFLGRIAPEKRPDRAIEIAAQAGMRLKIAAKIDRVDQDYWDEVIAPLVSSNPNVEYIGEIDESQKSAFLGNAEALLFPIDWPEPFGLVMIEAMACGTPVIAFECGSVPEIVTDGATGFVVRNIAEAVAATHRIGTIDRKRVRASFDERFTVRRMADDYVRVYQALQRRKLNGKVADSRRHHPAPLHSVS